MQIRLSFSSTSPAYFHRLLLVVGWMSLKMPVAEASIRRIHNNINNVLYSVVHLGTQVRG